MAHHRNQDRSTRSSDAVDVVMRLAARRLDDAAERIDQIGEALQERGERGRDDYRAMAQEVIDRAGARAKADLEEIARLLGHAGTPACALGLSQLNGARVRIHNAAAGAGLGLDTTPIEAVNELNRRLCERIGGSGEVAPAGKQSEEELLEEIGRGRPRSRPRSRPRPRPRPR